MNDPIQCSLYRCTNPDGSQKDWAIGENNGSVCVFYNKTGARTMRSTVVPPSKFHGSAGDEIRRRVQEQERDGYTFVTEVTIKDSKIVQSSAPSVPNRDELHWEVLQLTPSDFEEVIERLAKGFGKRPVAGVTIATQQGELICRYGPEATWACGASPRKEGAYMPLGKRAGGRITREYGVVPVLVLMGLNRLLNGAIAFTNEKGEPLELRFDSGISWLKPDSIFSEEDIRKLSARLGLRAPRFSDLEPNHQSSGIGFF